MCLPGSRGRVIVLGGSFEGVTYVYVLTGRFRRSPPLVEVRTWSQHLTAGLEPAATDDDLDKAEAAIEQFVPYLTEIIDQRRGR